MPINSEKVLLLYNYMKECGDDVGTWEHFKSKFFGDANYASRKKVFDALKDDPYADVGGSYEEFMSRLQNGAQRPGKPAPATSSSKPRQQPSSAPAQQQKQQKQQRTQVAPAQSQPAQQPQQPQRSKPAPRPMSESAVRSVYDQLSATGDARGTYEQFRTNFVGDGVDKYHNRLNAYRQLKAAGADVPDTYEQFMRQYMITPHQNTPHSTQKMSLDDMKAWAQGANDDVQGMLDRDKQFVSGLNASAAHPFDVNRTSLGGKNMSSFGGVTQIGNNQFRTKSGNVYNNLMDANSEQIAYNAAKSDDDAYNKIARIDKQIAALQKEADDERNRIYPGRGLLQAKNAFEAMYSPSAHGFGSMRKDAKHEELLQRIGDLKRQRAILLRGTQAGIDLHSSIDERLKQVNSALFDKYKTSESPNEFKYRRDQSGQNLGEYAKNQYLIGAARYLRDAQKMLTEVEVGSKEGNNLNGFLSGANRGLRDGLFDVRTWDMGYTDWNDKQAYRSVAEKWDRGENLTYDEQALLDAMATKMATDAYFASGLGRGYKAGQVTAESIPFMIEMLINPLSATGKSLQAMVARYALKRFARKGLVNAGKEMATTTSMKLFKTALSRTAPAALRKAAAKQFGARAVARVGGDIAGSYGMAATTGQVRVLADALNRMTGQARFRVDEHGIVRYDGHDAPEEANMFKAYWKALNAQAIENFSEMESAYFPYIFKFFGEGLNRLGGRAIAQMFGRARAASIRAFNKLPKADIISDFVQRATHNDVVDALNGIRRRANIGGPIEEYMEEVVGNIENAIIVGDKDFSTEQGKGVFNLSDNIDTFLGVGLMTGAFSVAGAAGYRTPHYRAVKALQQADEVGRRLYEGNEGAWEQLKQDLEECKTQADRNAVLTTVLGTGINQSQKQAVLGYVRASQFLEGVNNGTWKKMQEAAEHDDERGTRRGCINSYIDGQTMTDPQARREALLDFNAKRKRAMALEPDAELYDSPEMYDQLNPHASEEQRKAMSDYAQAKAKFDGINDVIEDRYRHVTSSIEDQVGRIANTKSGNIIEVELEGRHGKYYVRSGNISVNPEGYVNHSLSDKTVVFVDEYGMPVAGNMDASTIEGKVKITNAQSIIDGVRGRAEAIRNAEYDAMQGRLSFMPGSSFNIMDDTGEQHKVSIMQDEHGNVVAQMDGAEGALPLTDDAKATLQSKADMWQQMNYEGLVRADEEAKAQADAEATSASDDAAVPTSPTSLQQDQAVAFTDAEGNVHEGRVNGETADGGWEIEFDDVAPDGKGNVDTYTADELQALGIAPVVEGEAVSQESGAVSGDLNNTANNQPSETRSSDESAAPSAPDSEAEAVSAEPQQRAIDRIPTDESGQRIYEHASVEDTAAAILEEMGGIVDEAVDNAKIMLRQMQAKAEKAAQRVEDIRDGKVEASMDEIAQAKKDALLATQNVTYWENVVKFLEDVKRGTEAREESKAKAAEENAAGENAPAAEETPAEGAEEANTEEAKEVAPAEENEAKTPEEAEPETKAEEEKRRSSSSETLTTPSANQKADGVTLPSNDESSTDKVTESAAPAQAEEENSSSTADAKKRAEAEERLNVEIDKEFEIQGYDKIDYWATSYNSGELSREQLLRLEKVAESLGGSFDWDMDYFAMPSEEAAEKMKEAMIDEAAASDSHSTTKESKRESVDPDANLRADIRAARDMAKMMFPDANGELLDRVARDLNQQPLTREQRRQMEKIAEKFGLRIRWMKDMPQNGTYSRKKGEICIATNSWNQLAETFGHEMTHALKDMDMDAYNRLKDAVIEMAGGKKDMDGLQRYVDVKYSNYDAKDRWEEYVSDTIGASICSNDWANRILFNLDHKVLARMRDIVTRMTAAVSDFSFNTENKVRGLLHMDERVRDERRVPGSLEKLREAVMDAYRMAHETEMKRMAEEERKKKQAELERRAEENGGVSSVTDAANVELSEEDNDVRESMRTEDMVEARLRAEIGRINRRKTSKVKWSKAQADEIISETRTLMESIHAALEGNQRYDEWARRNPTMQVDWRDGKEKPVVTWSRNNVEYKFDVSADLLCVNNEGIEATLSSPDMVELMLEINGATKEGFTSADYMRLYETMRDLGLNVPCKGCFDAAARLKMLPSVSRKFVDLVNQTIDERNADPEAFDAALREKAKGGKKSVDGLPVSYRSKEAAIRAGVAGDNLTEHISWPQLMSAKGQTKALSDWGGIFRAWQRTGAGRPKDKLLPEPYIGDLTTQSMTVIAPYGEKTPSFREQSVNVGTGLRRNSHSELRPFLAIDEIQFMRDAFVKGLLVFKYMKELDDVRLFGQMGVKFNMSFFPAFDKTSPVAGLDKDGNYIASEESVGSREFAYTGEDGKQHYDGMKGMQEAQKYVNENVSLSSVVFSVPHLIKALTDVPTHRDKNGIWGSLIPFHSSGADSGQLAKQGLGIARANGVGHKFMEEAFTDYGRGVTNFEEVQNDRFGKGWTILEGDKAGTDVEEGHKLEFSNGTHYYNKALGLHLFGSWFVHDNELTAEQRNLLNGGWEDVMDGNAWKKYKDQLKKKVGTAYGIDYNDKVREIGGEIPYKEAADHYLKFLPEIGLMPRFDFRMDDATFQRMCADAHVDPHHPKLGWVEGKGWSPIDSDAYYSLWCDYGMTDPKTGAYSPHRPVGYIDENGNRSFKMPDNTVDIVRKGAERFSAERDREESMHRDVMDEFIKRSVEDGKLTQEQADAFTKKMDAGEFEVKESKREAWKNPATMSEEEKAARGKQLMNAPAINVASKQIVKTEDKSARVVAEEWWKDNVGDKPLVYNTEIGSVDIDIHSVKDSLAHRYSQAKLDAITSLKDGFNNAVYLGTLEGIKKNVGEKTKYNHYFAYPVNYEGEKNYVFCRVLEDDNKNRLYVHEVFIADNIQNGGNVLQTVAREPRGNIASYKSILANVLDAANVANNSETGQTSSEENGVRESKRSLVGVHNITEEKLAKALKLGGLANPSVAVIDTDKQSHNGFGGISLILPSEKIEGQATTFGDAETAMFPRRTKGMSLAEISEKMKQTNASLPITEYRRFVSEFMPRAKSLDEIRARKGLLGKFNQKEEDRREIAFERVAEALTPEGAKIFDTTGYERLYEAARHEDPVKFVEQEYGIKLSDNDAEAFRDIVAVAKNGMVTDYFETKFERPVMLNEFASAVVPSNVGQRVRKGLEDAGLELHEYDPKKEGDRERAFKEATEVDGVKFSKRTPSSSELALRDGLVDVLREAGLGVSMSEEEGQRVLDMVNGGAREHKVYHGSGADFDHFDHSHMNEGEGAQAYGWGTYVTEVEGIGRTYAKQIAYSNASSDFIESYDRFNNAKKRYADVMESYEMQLDNKTRLESYVPNEISKFERELRNAEEAGDKNESERIKDELEWVKSSMQDAVDVVADYENKYIPQAKQELDDAEAAYKEKQPTRHLYTVEIPDDTGSNYLDWDGAVTEEHAWMAAEALAAHPEEVGKYIWENSDMFNLTDRELLSIHDHPESIGKDDLASLLARHLSGIPKGKNLYHTIQNILGSDKNTSLALNEAGIVGMRYPADYRRGGRKDGAKNYVIFNEKDAQITDHVRFFRGENGEAYGFTVGGKIYIDPKHVNAETPIHEYAHLWSTALQQKDAKAWGDVVNLMKNTGIWDSVREAYPELKTDDEIADEVLATYSGQHGAERLREEMRSVMHGEGRMVDKVDALSALERVRNAIARFWRKVAGMLGIRYTKAEDVADHVLGDLLGRVNPNVGVETDGKAREMSFGEPYDYERYPLGRVEPNLAKKEIDVVEANLEHGFRNYRDAEQWAKYNICKTYTNEETGGKGLVKIDSGVINKYVSSAAREKSDSEDLHYAVLKVLPELIHNGIDAETHPNFRKVNGARLPENGMDKNLLMHRVYAAVSVDGKLCRVKISMKENMTGMGVPTKPYSYEVTDISTKIEPLETIGVQARSEDGISKSSISAANLLKDVEMSYNPGKKLLDASEDLPEVETKASAEEQGQIANEDGTPKYSLRTKPNPKKTQKVYKLMRLGDDGKLYPLFIDSSEPIEIGSWYDADSPGLDMMKRMPSGVHLIDVSNGESVTLEDFAEEHPEMFKGGKVGIRPSKEAVNYATENGLRWVKIDDTSRGQRRFGGEARKYWNIGINGSGAVSDFSMRPGWHAGSLPTMRQIGKGRDKNLRDGRFVWVEGEVPADIDYNEEAQRNADKDIPDHIPTDGFYMKATNADAVKSQADLVGWYVAGAFKANRVISDGEARSIIDKFNKEHGLTGKKHVLYDYDREGGVPFSEEDAARINRQNGVKMSQRTTDSVQSLSRDVEEGMASLHEELGKVDTKEDVEAVRKAVREEGDAAWRQANRKNVRIAEMMCNERERQIEDGEEADGEKYSLRDGSFIRSGSYFSGGGLLEEGLKNYLDPKVAVEFNEKIAGVYADNFGRHIVTADVRNVDPRELTAHVDGSVEYFHASPVCKNFSRAKREAGEVELDKETAQSTADFIRANRPRVVTIENVKGYRGSDAMKIITDALTEQGYDWDADVYSTGDFGGYTKRERLIVRAVRDGKLPEKPKPLPQSERKGGWMEAVTDLMDTLPEKRSGVPEWMDKRLKAMGIDWRHIDKPLYVLGQGDAADKVSHAFADELLPTLRTKGGDVIIMPDGRVLRATPRVLARVTGLADDYKMPVTDDMAHTIVGNGIPSQLSEHVVGPLLEHVFNGGKPITHDVKESRRVSGRMANTGNVSHVAQDIYEEAVRGRGFEMDEAWHDSLASVKALQDALAQERGADIRDLENVYLHMVHLSSVSAVEMTDYRNKQVENLLSAMDAILKDKNLTLLDEDLTPNRITEDDVEVYLNCKHSIERNEHIARKKAKAEADEKYADELKDLQDAYVKAADAYQKNPSQKTKDAMDQAKYDYDVKKDERDAYEDDQYKDHRLNDDYSGLTGIFDDPKHPTMTNEELEDEARDFVAQMESMIGAERVDALWDAIHDATLFSLHKSYKSGMISKDVYNEVKDMYEWYVPLRGFAEDTANDVYEYMEHAEPKTQQELKNAQGRKSRSDGILANIMNMGSSAILHGNQNLAKQKLLNLAINSKSSLLSLNTAYYKPSNKLDAQGNPYDELVQVPDYILNEEDADIRQQLMEQWTQQMEADPNVKTKFDKLNLDYKTLYGVQNEHAVSVFRGGKQYMVYVNGNPRAAQAINGTNIVRHDGAVSKAVSKVTRWMSQMMTSYNPSFVTSNAQRDFTSALLISEAKYGAGYTAKFANNVRTVFPFLFSQSNLGIGKKSEFFGMYQLYYKYNHGTLDMNKPIEKYFSEFMANGGETGYTQSMSVDDYKDFIEKELKNRRRNKVVKFGKKPFGAFMGFVEELNRGIENSCRFAAYMTSRETGRSVLQSVQDAKEASTNFNLHGSGALGNAFFRDAYAFINPAVQSLVQYMQLTKQHPVKMGIMAATTISLGAMVTFLMSSMVGPMGGGDGDDESDYWNINPYTRRNYLLIPMPGKGNWMKIAMAPEIRALYGLGVVAMEGVLGRTKPEDCAVTVLDQLNQLMPKQFVEPTETFKKDDGKDYTIFKQFMTSMTPTSVEPLWRAFLLDRDFMGRQITNQNDWNKDQPEWNRASYNTSEWLVNTSQWLNNFTADKGEYGDKGWFNFNPSRWGYLAYSYGAGIGQLYDQGRGLFKGAVQDDVDYGETLRYIPVFNRMFTTTDNDYNKYQQSNARFQYYEGIHDLNEYRFKNGKKMVQNGEKTNSEVVGDLWTDPDYNRTLFMDAGNWLKMIDKLKQLRKASNDENEQREYTKQINEVRKNAVSAIMYIEENGGLDKLNAVSEGYRNVKNDDQLKALNEKRNAALQQVLGEARKKYPMLKIQKIGAQNDDGKKDNE